MISIPKLLIMFQGKYFKSYAAFFLLIGSLAWSQFIEVNAHIDMRRLSDGDRQIFISLAEDIKNYSLNAQFSSVVSDLGMSIVTIFDATGRDVYMVQLVNRTNTIDVSNLANGTYRIVADTNDGRRMQTIVISH